jgi:hypothetical protein
LKNWNLSSSPANPEFPVATLLQVATGKSGIADVLDLSNQTQTPKKTATRWKDDT